MGSPSGVPLACICSPVTAAGDTRAAASAAPSSAAWLGPCGAVSAEALALVFTAEPSSSARGLDARAAPGCTVASSSTRTASPRP
jgi:hypothetical protein